MAQFSVGDRTFPRKADAEAHIKAVLRTTPLHATVADPTVRALVDLHPEAADRIGCGIDRIIVAPDEWTDRCFWIIRTDGTRVSFSYRTCLRHPTHRGKVAEALRHEVADQIVEFRDTAPWVCALTGGALQSGDIHVDHVHPNTFARLMRDWVATQGGTENIPVVHSGQRSMLADPGQSRSWQDHHRAHARLRLLSKAAHAAETNRQARKPAAQTP